jgi:hypothetical protein
MAMSSDLLKAITSVLIIAAIHPSSATLATKGHVSIRTISFCAGIALAYLFLHLLPELSRLQLELQRISGENHQTWLEEHVYIIALAGLLFFQIADSIGRNKESKRAKIISFRVEMFFFSLYSALISYLIIKTVELNQPTILVTIAFSFHFFGTDLDLTERYENAFTKRGCYILSIATIVGMLVALYSPVRDIFYIAGFSFLVGGILINTLRTELPQPQKVKNAFVIFGTVVYSALLLLIYYISRNK